MPGERSLTTLEEILRTSSDERIQRAAISAISNHPSSRAKQSLRAIIERNDANENMRRVALSTFDKERATPEDAAYLRNLYGRIDSYRMKESVLNSIARIGSPEDQAWLLNLARNGDQPIELRVSALRYVSGSSSVAIADVVKLYDSIGERPLREQLINVYGYRKEPEATDKLIDIAKNGTDPNLRRQAIAALTRKNDPRTAKLLLEIIGGEK
jgi:HEAT repeat protein